MGSLHIESDVPGADVFIDRVYIGATPVTAENVTLGRHTLNVSAPGFDGVAETIDVESGPRGIRITFREVRLDARLDVVHKHRFGECEGTLVATPRELRYETTNADDHFTTAVTSLELFEIDYLDRTLRVKLPRGRQYVFTDPEGDADRLFVFHRDVEAARERLQRGDPPAAR
jgi:hypothetical protein